MKRYILIFAGLMASLAVQATPDMKPGLWELSMSTEMPGMPAAAQQPFKMQHCYRAGEMKDPRTIVPQKNPNCMLSDVKESGNTVSWKISCTGKMPMTGAGRVTYSGTSYSGVARLTMNQGGRNQDMLQKYSGKRLGDCR
jgi:hypothetical protein